MRKIGSVQILAAIRENDRKWLNDASGEQSLESKAAEYAMNAHSNQRRKVTGEPYVNHCGAVADLVAHYCGDDPYLTELLAAAWLHDTIEDCAVTANDIIIRFGPRVAILVIGLTSASKIMLPYDAPRVARKRMDREHMLDASPAVQKIKACDIIHNAQTIDQIGSDFALMWIAESHEMLHIMNHVRGTLYNAACVALDACRSRVS